MLAKDQAILWGTNHIGRAARRRLTGARLDATFQKRGVKPLMRHIGSILAGILFPIFASAFDANAVELISNGGFETGLTGWTVASSAGSGGSWFADTATFTPLTGNPTVGPFSGTAYAVTDQFGPGVNALSQAYTVPMGTTSLTLAFDMFINDWAPSTGDERMSVLILGAGGNPVTGAGTLSTLFSGDTLVTGGQPNPYIAYSFSIIGFVPGDTYILALQETDTMYNMNVGVDDVSLETAAVPEPNTVALLLGVLVALGAFGWRRRGLIRHQRKLLFLAAVALFSQPVYAQNQNVAYPVMPRATLQPGHSRSYAWVMSILDPSAVVRGPGQTNCGGGPGQDLCFYFPTDVNTAYTTNFITNGGGAGRTVALSRTPFSIARRRLI